MISFVIGALLGLTFGAFAAYNLGYDRHVNAVADEMIGKAEAQRERELRGTSRWPFVAVGAFVVAMLVLGVATR